MRLGTLGTLMLAAGISSQWACRAQGPRSDWISPQAVVLDLPLVEQDELHECGLAAVTVLARYWGRPLPAEESAQLSRLAGEREGLSGSELRAALERNGWEVWIFRGALEAGPTGLYHHIDAGRPLLVMISPDGRTNHYCLVLGYDPLAPSVLLLDPRRGRVATDLAAFERAWDHAQRFTLLAVPRGTGVTGAVALIPPGVPLPLERVAIELRADTEIEALRAGAPGPAGALGVVERAALELDQAAAAVELEALRAGDLTLTERELTIIGITAAAILLLVLIF